MRQLKNVCIRILNVKNVLSYYMVCVLLCMACWGGINRNLYKKYIQKSSEAIYLFVMLCYANNVFSEKQIATRNDFTYACSSAVMIILHNKTC